MCSRCGSNINNFDCGCRRPDPCRTKTTRSFTDVKYTGSNLSCSGINRGDDFNTIVRKLNEVACNESLIFEDNEECENGGFIIRDGQTILYSYCNECCSNDSCDLSVSINPDPDSNYPDTPMIPEIIVDGGTPPYSYMWTLQQTGGSRFIIDDPTLPDLPIPFVNMSLPIGDCVGAVSSIPCRVSNANAESTSPTHVFHFKLEVTDANGCKDRDYWTMYWVNTY